MNTSDIPTQLLDCLDYWITCTLVRCSLLTSYASEHDGMGDLFEDQVKCIDVCMLQNIISV